VRLARLWTRRQGRLALVVIALAFLAVFGRVLAGQRSLVPEDILYLFLPWSRSASFHGAHNALIGDVAFEMYPWYVLVRDGLLHARWPVWNPYAFGGSPLMANGQSAPLSPFTLVTLPFPPGYGFSLMLLLKFWVAGTGTALFVRRLRVAWLPAILGGLAFATSAFMVSWLGYPHTAVAALVPWGFFAAETYADSGSRRALAGLGAVIGLQFLAGHTETSVHFCGALAVYALVRCAASGPARWRRLGGLALAATAGLMLAAVQLVPFLDLLRRDPFYAERVGSGAGLGHLPPRALLTWLVPNRIGNPGIDGLIGQAPNYNEAVGFADVWALALCVPGFWWLRRARPSAGWTLGVLGAASALVVYGPLSPVAGRLPLLNGSNNSRLMVVVEFSVAVLGAAGLHRLLAGAGRARSAAGAAAALVAAIDLAALATCAVLVFVVRDRVDRLLPSLGNSIGFWLLVAALSLLAVAALAYVAWRWRPPVAAAGFLVLATLEAVVFAGPYNPQVFNQDVPPTSRVMSWLRDHAGSQVVAFVDTAPPESSSLYRVRDVGGYDPFIDQRQIDYWTGAGGGTVSALHLQLTTPSLSRLRAAGVAYVVAREGHEVPGTDVVLRDEGVSVAAVAGAAPPVYAVNDPTIVGGPAEAISAVDRAGGRAVALEGGSAQGGATVASTVTVRDQAPGGWSLSVSGASPSTLVVNESYEAGWRAKVDGLQVPVRPVNAVVMGIQVPAGEHQVEFSYQPRGFGAGVLASLLGLLLVVAGMALPVRRRAVAAPVAG
jgi:hypothetical protein